MAGNEQPIGRPTLRDVARLAGLSVTQVSRALNGHADVAAATRERAQRAADQLGYAPNIAARRLKMADARSHSIGLVLPPTTARLSDPFLGELLAWMVEEASGRGFELQLSTPPADEPPVASYERAIRHERVDGFVVLRTSVADERVAYLLEQSFPFVTFGRVPGMSGFRVVDEADEALQPAVDLLVGLGHRRIACMTEPSGHSKAIHRLRSFEQAMAAHGLRVAPDQIVEAGFHEDSGYAAAKLVLDRDDPPTAVVALNDLLAMGVLRATSERGLRVPGDLSVVGFDDITAARLVTPPLTTLCQPIEEMGRLLVREVLAAIDEAGEPGPAPEPRLIVPQLVVRGSTGRPDRGSVDGHRGASVE